MSDTVLKKRIPNIGLIEYKAASTRQELEAAFSLVYKEYLTRGFILPKFYKASLRMSLQNALPDTVTLIALNEGRVVATCTLMPDSLLGLPMDSAYKRELDRLRKGGRRICEVGQLAINSDFFGRGFFSMFNFNKLDFLFTLFKLIFQYALFYAEFDDICIVTNPKYLIFKFLLFETIGPTKYYGYDCAGVKKKAAVPKRFNLQKTKIIHKTKPVLARMFLGSRVPKEFFEDKFKFDLKDLQYFFVEKSNILEKANKDDLSYIGSLHNITEEEFKSILAKRCKKRTL